MAARGGWYLGIFSIQLRSKIEIEVSIVPGELFISRGVQESRILVKV
jgi:hypothetical protein